MPVLWAKYRPRPTLDLAGAKGETVYEVLGFLNEYSGRIVFEDNDVVERFYANERDRAATFEALLRRLAEEQQISPAIREVDRESVTYLHSAHLRNALDALYEDRREGGFSERPEGMLPVLNFYVSASMFPADRRDLKLAYLSGAYARYGRGNAIGFANAHHKAIVLADLLRDLGCGDVRVESTVGYAPQTNVVYFSPSGEVRRFLKP